MTTIQVTNVQQPAGRRTDYVLVFGYRVGDLLQRPVCVATTVADAMWVVQERGRLGYLPEVEVDDGRWMHCGPHLSVSTVFEGASSG